MSHHIESRADTAWLHLPGTGGGLLAIGPRHLPPVSDDLLITIVHGAHHIDRRSVVLSRTQTGELTEWLSSWLRAGWPGVTPTEGPSTAEVITHYQQVAVGERVRADQERVQAARLLHAALRLIPTEHRGADLHKVAAEDDAQRHRLSVHADQLEHTRMILTNALVDIAQSTSWSAAALRTRARQALAAARRAHTTPADTGTGTGAAGGGRRR